VGWSSWCISRQAVSWRRRESTSCSSR
jgi:hypothetical protein